MRAVVIIVAALWAGCSDKSCQPGTLNLHLALLDDAPLADTIRVHGDDPGAAVDVSFAHTPNQDAVTVGIERIAETIVWPGGYPKNALVHLHVRALAAGVVVGEQEVDLRLDPGCSETYQLVPAPSPTMDGGVSD
jgi:hypothetical protein